MKHPPLTHQSLRLLLEQARLRCTPQRLAVYGQLCQSSHHPTAEEVFQVYDLPTRFDPDLVRRLDPELSNYLDRRGFQLMGYQLKLLGYQVHEGEPEPSFPHGHPDTQPTQNCGGTPTRTPGLVGP